MKMKLTLTLSMILMISISLMAMSNPSLHANKHTSPTTLVTLEYNTQRQHEKPSTQALLADDINRLMTELTNFAYQLSNLVFRFAVNISYYLFKIASMILNCLY